MHLDGLNVLVAGSTPFAQEVRATLVAEGARLLDGATLWAADEPDILVDLGEDFAAKPFLQITDDDWRSGFEDNVVQTTRNARRVLPTMLLANRGILVFLLRPRETEAPWEEIHREVTYRARLTLIRELEDLVKDTDVSVASVPSAMPEGQWLRPEEGNRRLEPTEIVAVVVKLAHALPPRS